MTSRRPDAVVGGGPAAGAAARALASAGRHVVLLTAEERAPYDRTVLSKDVLLRPGAEASEVWPAGAPWRERIEVRTGAKVVSLDPGARRLVTASGDEVVFESVILATGRSPGGWSSPGPTARACTTCGTRRTRPRSVRRWRTRGAWSWSVVA
ncbi:FAD-dependent oxidoreductase [Phycicoccus sp. HDW14]|nr:FAD-dependent oxidoreductase [Phycicoccus sp. HDW14]